MYLWQGHRTQLNDFKWSVANHIGRVFSFNANNRSWDGDVGGGDYDVTYDAILEFKPEDDTIVTLGHMTQPRYAHAISVVQTQDYSNWCQ